MQTYHYPTTILYDTGALDTFVERFGATGASRPLVVSDATLVELGITDQVTERLLAAGAAPTVFAETHPNPIEADVEEGARVFAEANCDAIIAVGGGSPIDVAKVIKIAVAHDGPLARYDEAVGGDARIVNPMPPLYAIPTTAGTGSEVGRSGVIIMRDTNRKTIFFAPQLLPDVAVLDPMLTLGLPPTITAATGLDALTHCLEAYFAPGFHPMADGIALGGIELIVANLPLAYRDGSNSDARARMLLAAAMGATAFQKGLGMIHSLAHPLSTRYGTHHGLANALLLPESVAFLERANLTPDQQNRIDRVRNLLVAEDLGDGPLAETLRAFISSLGVPFGLSAHGVEQADLDFLTDEAFADPCHNLNMIPVSRADLAAVYRAAM